jgi:Na+-translocating ferredoxin:NAD+ oxidoreductase RnfG subunit
MVLVAPTFQGRPRQVRTPSVRVTSHHQTPCWGDGSTSRTSTRENWYGVAAVTLHGRKSIALFVRVAVRVG